MENGDKRERATPSARTSPNTIGILIGMTSLSVSLSFSVPGGDAACPQRWRGGGRTPSACFLWCHARRRDDLHERAVADAAGLERGLAVRGGGGGGVERERVAVGEHELERVGAGRSPVV